MARRGAAQQLQADINTDEELEKFITKPGLIVLEVFSAWCGPCLGLMGTLRKAKLDIGENLSLAVCRADTVASLNRFYKRSEPVFLFVSNGRATNIFYGSDAPKLMTTINKELEKALQPFKGPTYDIWELQPVEAEARRVKLEALDKAERIEFEKKHKKRVDYLNRCTDIIMENLPDVGVTIFGPQVSRDMFKKLQEPADQLKMQCKDRKYMEVSEADFELINYACKNPLSEDIIEQLSGRELLICYWKIDESSGPVPTVLATYAHEVTKERVAPPDDEINVPHPIPPLLTTLKLKVEVEVPEGESWEDEISSEEEARRKAAARKSKSITRIQEGQEGRGKEPDGAEEDIEEEGMEEEEVGQGQGPATPAFPGVGFELDLGLDDDVVSEEEVEEEEEVVVKVQTRIKIVKIPPIWVANSRRTHASLIYTFFRNQTTGFLPQDPPPEPPHVIMAFEAHKHDEIMEFVEGIKDEVPLYGFFTDDNPADAKLISNSVFRYDQQDHNMNDRFVLKVNKVQSNTMLSLVQFEPTYVSSNVTSGKVDALKFFPEDYKTDEELPPDMVEKPKKQKKKAEAAAEKKHSKAVSRPQSVADKPPEPTGAPAPTPAPAEGEAAQAPAAEEAAGAADTPPSPPEGGEAAPAEAPATEEAAPAAEATPATEAAAEAAPAADAAPAPESAPAPETTKEEAPAEAPPPAPEAPEPAAEEAAAPPPPTEAPAEAAAAE